jgi:hypothetical protein
MSTWCGAAALSAKCQKRTFHYLFDDLVGAGEQRDWHLYPDRLGGLEVDHQFKFCRLLDRKIRRFRTLENSVHISRCAPEEIHFIRANPARGYAERCAIPDLAVHAV